jgi:hypothetical protein
MTWETYLWIGWVIVAYGLGRLHQYDRDWHKKLERSKWDSIQRD